MDEKDLGVQPLDGIMIKFGLSNHDLVRVSTQQLTHKMVQKARQGKKLTLNARQKVLTALKLAVPEHVFSLKDLFHD